MPEGNVMDLLPNERIVNAAVNLKGNAQREAVQKALDDGADRLVWAYFMHEGQSRLEAVREALAAGSNPDVDFGDYKYPTLLVHAIGEGDLEMVDTLVKGGAELHMEMEHTADGALGYALMQDQWDIALYLIANGSDVNRWNDLRSELHGEDGYAGKRVEVVRAMVMAGAMCDEPYLQEIELGNDRSRYWLEDEENYWEDDAPTLLDKIREWRAERDRVRLALIASSHRPNGRDGEEGSTRRAM